MPAGRNRFAAASADSRIREHPGRNGPIGGGRSVSLPFFPALCYTVITDTPFTLPVLKEAAMKPVLSALLSALLVLSLAACGSPAAAPSSSGAASSPDPEEQSRQEQEAPDAEQEAPNATEI